jgi:hypothetical protein
LATEIMDILSYLAIRTAAPFGYLVIVAALVGAGVVGLVALWQGLRARPRRLGQALAGGALFAAVALLIGMNLIYDATLEMNPMVTVPDLAGAWRNGSVTLDLRADGTYQCTGGAACAGFGPTGRWTRDGDFLLLFTPAGDGERLVQRVVRYAGQLRLTEEVEDPDTWSGALTFRHPAPAS